MDLIPIVESDKSFFRDLNKLAYRDLIERQFGEWNEDFQEKAFEKKWKEQDYKKIVLDGSVIGGIWVQEFNAYHQLREIQLLPTYRNRGIGTDLVKNEIARAKKLGKKLKLRVLLLNPAFELYKRFGFVVTEQNDVQYHMEHNS